MYVRSILIPSLILLAGCVPYNGYYREGASVAKLNSDLTDCEVLAAQKVPQNTQINTTPIYTTPITTQCYGYTCTTSGGHISGGNTYSYDANNGLRNRVEAQCMSRHGYQRVEIPLCSSSVAKSAPYMTQRVLPRLTANTCAVRLKSGSYVFAQGK